MKSESPVILRRASWAAAIFGVLAFWAGMMIAAQRYPSEYDWRYMPVSRLLSPVRDPDGYLWALAGIVLYSLCGLYWTALLARRWNQAGAQNRPGGIRALQFGYFFTIGAAMLPQWLLRIERGHELLTVLAFAGLCIGMVRLMFQTIEPTLMRKLRRFTGRARLLAGILAGAAVFPIVLAAMAQAYVHYALPELRWVSLSWRARGVPVYLSFAFWEWVTCFVLSAYAAILSLTTDAVSPKTS
jgi:hypothetical protein